MQITRKEKLAEIKRLYDLGASDVEISRRTGYTIRKVSQYRAELGLYKKNVGSKEQIEEAMSEFDKLKRALLSRAW